MRTKVEQRSAFQEIARVIKPDGLFLLIEINTINPVIRYYMNNIFPKLKNIDNGDEVWIDPRNITELIPKVFAVRNLTYFTFIPDFTPRFLMKYLMPLEKTLEISPVKHLSAHYIQSFLVSK